MYTMVLMMAMGGSADVPDFGRDRGGCSGAAASCKGDRGGFLGMRDRDRGGCHGSTSCHGAVVVASGCHGSGYGASCHGNTSCHGSDRGGFLGLRNRDRGGCNGRTSCHGMAAGCHGAHYSAHHGGCHGAHHGIGTSCHGMAANWCGTVTTGCTGVIVTGAPLGGAIAMPPPPVTGKEGVTGTTTKDPNKKEE